MVVLFFILMILSSVIISFFILVQNPKGGGLAGNIAGFNSQFMGVKQTTDVLEKGTWVIACLIALLCLLSPIFMGAGKTSGAQEPNLRPNATQQQNAPATPQLPTGAETAPLPAAQP